MSTPWQWLGSYFPTCENLIDPIANPTGSGTAWPVVWNRTDGVITPDQMSQFEWPTKEITFSVSGSVTLVFTDYTGGGGADTSKTQAFSYSIVQTKAGTTWDVNEPVGDYVNGGQHFLQSGGFVVPVTLPWGPDAFVFGLEFDIDDLLGLIGSEDGDGNCTLYTKAVVCDIACATSQPTPTAYSAVDAALNSAGGRIINGLTIAPLPTDNGQSTAAFYLTSSDPTCPNVFSGSAGMGAAGSSITITSFSLTATANFTQPPDI